MSVWHPERAREFLRYIVVMALVVVGAKWVQGGMHTAELPREVSAIAVITLWFAWWPAVYALLPVLSRLGNVLSLPYRVVVRLMLFAGFVAWGLAINQAGYLLEHSPVQ